MANVSTVLAAATAWLYDTEQPEAAIMQHHGTSRRFGDRSYSVTPTGAHGLPVIVIEVADWSLGSTVRWRGFGGEFTEADVLAALRNEVPVCDELRRAAALLEESGIPVRETWNGAPWQYSGSIGLARTAHPSLVATVLRYRAGCPEHGTVFCGWQGSTSAERACTWYADGNRLIIPPTWPDGEEVPVA